MSLPRPTYRHVPVSPPAVSLFAPHAVPDLFLAAYGSVSPEGLHHQLHLTDLVSEADLPAAWAALEAAYRFSGATFALIQRLALTDPGGHHPARATPAPTLAGFFSACPYYTHDRPVEDGALLCLTFGPAADEVRVQTVADLRALDRATGRMPIDEVRIAARRVGTLAWHIHM